MSRTVTALYDTRAEAEAARQRLSSAVDVERVKIIDKGGEGSGGSSGSLGNVYMSHEDRHAYSKQDQPSPQQHRARTSSLYVTLKAATSLQNRRHSASQ
jgi:hypothetical protein